jgi:hypothetical protein
MCKHRSMEKSPGELIVTQPVMEFLTIYRSLRVIIAFTGLSLAPIQSNMNPVHTIHLFYFLENHFNINLPPKLTCCKLCCPLRFSTFVCVSLFPASDTCYADSPKEILDLMVSIPDCKTIPNDSCPPPPTPQCAVLDLSKSGINWSFS